MTEKQEQPTAQVNQDLMQEVINKIASQRNEAYNKIATLEIQLGNLRKENMRLKATIEAEKEFKKKDK
jgi:flagellar motor switch protein FliM